ncbi:hypothetical protein [Rhizobium sp. 007]|uniref:hypothetical protein n=1 Tax=Rhizobium sp. 007 TaxID=2785056 RepID=UPI001890553D|nr:hypothetical protein [Rhizobium sp. 007]QPB23944.1 hypothetical protein ISN39_31420 [Rhizobium sp. 007]
MATERETKEKSDASSAMERRDFIKGLGKFAALTPPAVTVLLDVAMNSPAVAASGGRPGRRPGWGNGDKNHVHTGPPKRRPRTWWN